MRYIDINNIAYLHHGWKRHLRAKKKKSKTPKSDCGEQCSIIQEHSEPSLVSFMTKFCENKSSLVSIGNKIRTPKNFCIFSNPKEVLSWLRRFITFSLQKKVVEVTVDHTKTRKFCLTSEVLLGLIAKDIQERRKFLKMPIEYNGILNKNNEHSELLAEVGIVSELKDAFSTHQPMAPEKIHVFKQDCFRHESASSTSDDLKSITSQNFVEHLNKALRDHQLKLTESAAGDIKGCLGEIIDNANEHSGTTAPVWYVRGYVNNQEEIKVKYLELMVANLGKSISDTFTSLVDSSMAKREAKRYVEHHLGHGFTKEELYSVAALQGNISSKNTDDDATRGQGTIKLIETFEQLYNNYLQLRRGRSDVCAQMNLISGGVIIRFDGKLKSQVVQDVHGGERVIMPFNELGDLRVLPDGNYVSRIDGAYFPGLLINIRIPLTGSTTPLRDDD
ncbi:TPA: hypothetical protein ACSPZX_000376 [Aeromonas veronii]|uniref:hypothetical protein n=1 Tax=Aeromonas sp. Lyrl_2 TaxID=3110921 RepID=UPI003A29DB83